MAFEKYLYFSDKSTKVSQLNVLKFDTYVVKLQKKQSKKEKQIL